MCECCAPRPEGPCLCAPAEATDDGRILLSKSDRPVVAQEEKREAALPGSQVRY